MAVRAESVSSPLGSSLVHFPRLPPHRLAYAGTEASLLGRGYTAETRSGEHVAIALKGVQISTLRASHNNHVDNTLSPLPERQYLVLGAVFDQVEAEVPFWRDLARDRSQTIRARGLRGGG